MAKRDAGLRFQPSGGTRTPQVPTGKKQRLNIERLANDGMTMICVTHEMNFAREVADKIVFMDFGEIVEANTPERFFSNPSQERTRLFLAQVLR